MLRGYLITIATFAVICFSTIGIKRTLSINSMPITSTKEDLELSSTGIEGIYILNDNEYDTEYIIITRKSGTAIIERR